MCSKSGNPLETACIKWYLMDMIWSLKWTSIAIDWIEKKIFFIIRANHWPWFPQIPLEVASVHILGVASVRIFI